MENIIAICIPAYIFFTFFYGIIIKLTFKNSFIFSLKTIVPELLLIIIAMCGLTIIIKELKIRNKYTLNLWVYITLLFLMNLFVKPDMVAVFYLIRDIILPITIFFILTQIEFTYEVKDKIINRIIKVFILFIILGSILCIVQSIKGWEWSSKFYTGYPFYGTDPVSKIKIWESGRLLRTPSVTGNSAIFGVYSLITLVFVLKSNIKYKHILLILNIMSLVLSTSKTPLIIAIFILFKNILKKYNKKMNIALYNIAALLMFILLLVILNKSPEILFSLKERVMFWNQLNTKLSMMNLAIPLELFGITSAAEGVLSFMDNTYLYFIYSTGLMGLVLVLVSVLSFYKAKENDYPIKEMIISFIILSMFTNITQGRSYFTIYVLLMPLIYSNKDNKIKQLGEVVY